MLPGDGPTDPPDMSDDEYIRRLEAELNAVTDAMREGHGSYNDALTLPEKVRLVCEKAREYRVALEAVVAWFEAEDQNIGTFHDRMDLCKYAEWSARKALGEDVGEFQGVPQLRISLSKSDLDTNSAKG